ncbi:polysaccharide lyase [Geomonas oryzisoli]|uniref:Polysaccharide lyase n=1 Tax=Geomonas oryzisoli TaxID=2847992 RepID=A0ABX8J0U3_9BACT|nr:heparin lyase I family protein [Geomonas oryzisoli]QWV91838.1 polysaccharide lyase [Geomonas oryzisoli]
MKNVIFSFVLCLMAQLIFLSSTSHAGVFFKDGFESGDKAHTENGAKWLSSSSTVTISSDIARTGNKSMKFHFAGVPLGQDDDAEQRFSLGSARPDVYIQYYVFFPLNYVHRNDSPTNNKAIMLWDEEANYTWARAKMGAHLWYNSAGDALSPFTGLDFNYSPPQLTCKTGSGSNTSIDSISLAISNFGKWTLDKTFLGRWLCFEWHFKLDSGAGDGALEFWVDGVKQFGQTNMKWNGAPCSPGYFKTGYLFGWANSGFDVDTDIYVDDVTFSDMYIPVAPRNVIRQ